jgi:hypothetical protein
LTLNTGHSSRVPGIERHTNKGGTENNKPKETHIMYTYQTVSESGSFSNPEGSDVEHAQNKRDLRRALERWQDDHGRVGSDEMSASLIVWKGELGDVTDVYPDFEVRPGPRGGARFESC